MGMMGRGDFWARVGPKVGVKKRAHLMPPGPQKRSMWYVSSFTYNVHMPPHSSSYLSPIVHHTRNASHRF